MPADDLVSELLTHGAKALIDRFMGPNTPAPADASAPIEVTAVDATSLRANADALRARIAGAAGAVARAAAVAEVDLALRSLYMLLHPTVDCADAAQWDIKAVRRRAPRGGKRK